MISKADDAARFEDFDIDDIKGPCLDTAFFIDGLVPRRGVHVFYGPSSVGKTFTVIHMLLHVAAGRRYAGHDTEKALVIYVTGEGEQMFQNRIWLAKKKLGIERGEAAFRGITDMPNMAKTADETKALLAKIRTITGEGRYAGLPVIVVIDTVSTALMGAREDEAGLGIFMSNSKLIAKETDGLTIGIHHTGKDTASGPRGSYLTIANPDAVTRIEENEAGTGGTMIIEKMRDGSKDLAWTFERKVETLGDDPRGRPITTCHIVLTSEPKFQKRKRGPAKKAHTFTGPELIFQDAFNEVAIAKKTKIRVGPHLLPAVEATALRDEFYKRYVTGEGKEASQATKRQAWNRATMNPHLLRVYHRETRDGTEWFWIAKDEPDDRSS